MSDESSTEPIAERPRPPRWALSALIAGLIAVVVASWVGDALTTTWAEEHPLALVLLNARNRVLVLTTNQLDAVSYYGAAGLRLLVADPLFYVLGYYYGDSAVRWLERKSPSYGPLARQAETLFGRYGYPLVFVAPNAYICLFAGAARMHVGAFLAVNTAGTIGRLYLIRRVGEAFESPLDDVLGFFRDFRWPLLIASVALVAFTIWNERRHGRGSLDSVAKLPDELDQEKSDRD